jgi:hypothetical protein
VDGLVDDRKALSHELEPVPLLDLLAMRREVRHVAVALFTCCPLGRDGSSDGFFTNGRIVVKPAVAVGGPVNVVLRTLDHELHRVAMAAH